MPGVRPGSSSSGLRGAHPGKYAKPRQSMHNWKKGPGQLLEAGDVSLHGAGQLAAMGEGRCGASPGVAVLTARGWEGMDGESAQTSSAAEVLDLDHEVGAGAPAPERKAAEVQQYPAVRSAWPAVSPQGPQ